MRGLGVWPPSPVLTRAYPATGVEPGAAQSHNRMSGGRRDPQNRSSHFLHIWRLDTRRSYSVSSVNLWFPQYLHNSVRRWEITLRRAWRGRVRARSVNARDTRRLLSRQESISGKHRIFIFRCQKIRLHGASLFHMFTLYHASLFQDMGYVRLCLSLCN